MSTKEAKQSVDLSALDGGLQKQEEGLLVPIVGMDGKTPLGFSIRVAGPDSERARKATDALNDELIEAGDISEMKSRERSVRGVRYLAKITMGWEPSLVFDGEELAYSEENAVKLFTRYAFIAAQVDRKAARRADFLKG